MYVINLLRNLRKFRPSRIRILVSSRLVSRSCQSQPARPKYTSPTNTNARVETDVVLYSLESPRLFLYLNVLSVVQCMFWTYLGLDLYFSLTSSDLSLGKKKMWSTLENIQRKYGAALSIATVLFGWTALVGTFIYTSRSVRKIILHRGGRNVTIITYSVPGLNNILQIPLSKISASGHRKKVKKYLPVRVKDKLFYYLIDNKGKFSNPELFDFTVGVQRSF